MVKKIIPSSDLPKISSPDCIPAMVLKKRKPELFNMRLKDSCFQTVNRSHLSFLYLRMLRGLQLKPTALLAFFLWLLKSLEMFWLVNRLEE